MQIRQLQVACDRVQDRLLLRVATSADEEYRLWLTRAFLRELWPHLVGLLGGQPHTLPGTAEMATKEATSFEPAFRDDNATFPLGSTPLLVSEVTASAPQDGNLQLTFREGRERSFQLGLTADLLQTLCAMLRAGAEQAHWNLPLDYNAPASADSLSDPRPARLH